MRYLSKIVLIESANVRYTEVNLDGNVHFVGTQGVGKSTLLRALLFFYNANQQKLGIPIGKKTFVDFYFPYPNSYIIYEVTRETGAYCILLSKSQGRVCFRFIDSPYNRDYFIDKDGYIFDSWDSVKLALGRDRIGSTKKIERYEDYRNILYGNNQGLGNEFKKYALLESKQYQNIPRAIQHVFLNYKVESEFIKDTIIKSLNEEEIKIDLSNYSHHLKDFENQLGDIKKWTEKTKGGEILVKKQAENVISKYAAIQYNENEKIKVAGELLWKLDEITQQKPTIKASLELEDAKLIVLYDKLKNNDRRFQNKKDRITGDLNVFDSKLKEAKRKEEEYKELNIEYIISKVSKKIDWETEKEGLNQQKNLLEANFTDIKQKYEAQIQQLNNQCVAFENLKESEGNTARQSLYSFKEDLTKEYDNLYDDIREQHQEKVRLANSSVDEKKTAIYNLSIQKTKAENTRYYESEIDNLKVDIQRFKERIRIAKSDIKDQNAESETARKQWDLEKEKIETKFANQREKITTQIQGLNLDITSISSKIENSRDSLYGWLNNELPGWENTIGKVIDEEDVLFRSDLSPQINKDAEANFYGINLDLSEIDKSVKTVADYEIEKADFIRQIDNLKVDIAKLDEYLNVELEALRKRQQSKINKCKEAIRKHEYDIESFSNKVNDDIVSQEEWITKAAVENRRILAHINNEIEKVSAEKIDAEKVVAEVGGEIKKRIDNKKREKDRRIASEQTKLDELIFEIKLSIDNMVRDTQIRINDIASQKDKELNDKGANTERINAYVKRIDELNVELDFIENNRDKVVEYKKDKTELFDKVSLFKSKKSELENELNLELTKYRLQEEKNREEINALKDNIERIKKVLAEIDADLDGFELFKMTECYNSNLSLLNSPVSENKTIKRCTLLIDEFNGKYFSGIERDTDLQTAIHKFNGNFSSHNIFKFKTNLIDKEEYFQFSEDLKEFVEEDKISLFEKRINEFFADIIKLVGKETTDLLSKEGEIESVIREINLDFVKRIFTGVIKSIEMRVVPSENRIVHLLTEIKKFNDEHIHDIGSSNLFSIHGEAREGKNKEAIRLLSLLTSEITKYKHTDINLSDTFELQFKVIENDNDTNWVQSLANVGSNGTDVLVKAMINIMLLNVFKEGATKNKFKDFRLHCMVDEIGTLHIENVRGLLRFANDRNINILNGSPQSLDALAYRYTYKLAKKTDPNDGKPVTIINRLITNNRER